MKKARSLENRAFCAYKNHAGVKSLFTQRLITSHLSLLVIFGDFRLTPIRLSR